MKIIKYGLSYALFLTCAFNASAQLHANQTSETITIDGFANEATWSNAESYPIDQVVIGENLQSNDFTGRFKTLWDENYIYLMLDITDDSLSDDHSNPTDNYWNDDCVEIFIDEDNGKENHQYNHKAFAYHVSIFGDVVDMGLSQNPILLNDHVASAYTKDGNRYQWELAIKVFDDTFNENNASNMPLTLTSNKLIGFTLGYCDNDESTEREHFILSNAGQANTGYITSEHLGTLSLDPLVTDDIDELQVITKVYPNVFMNEIMVRSSVTTRFDVISEEGVKVYSARLNSGITTINLSHLAKGIYIAVLNDTQTTLVKQ